MSDPKITIYHNPACGTSRNTLALIRNSGVEPTVIHYLETPPSRETLVTLIAAMGMPVRDLLRPIVGELVDDHRLVVTFPHSNMRYVTSLPGENAECLCHGPVEVFEHISGVSPVIVMDNACLSSNRSACHEVVTFC